MKRGRTSNLLRRIPTRSFGLTLLRDKAIFQVVFRTSTSSTNVAFPRFFATRVAHRVLCWTIADEMTRLRAPRKFPDPVGVREMLTVLQILQIYPSGGFVRSGQSVIKC